jgi:dihydroorotase
LNVPGGTLTAGAPADITILAPDLPVTVDVSRFRSKSKNSPFNGWTLRGGVAATILGGRITYRNEQIGATAAWQAGPVEPAGF